MGIEVKDIHIKEWEMVDGVNKLVIKQTHRFVQPKKEADGSVLLENRGIIPKTLLKLLGARKKYRAKIKFKIIISEKWETYL